MEINVSVSAEKVVTDKKFVAAGNYKQIKLKLELSSDFDNLVVRVVLGNKSVTVLNGECYLPPLKTGRYIFGVYGYSVEDGKLVKRVSPQPTYLVVTYGSFNDDSDTPTELEEFYNQITNKFKSEIQDVNSKLDMTDIDISKALVKFKSIDNNNLSMTMKEYAETLLTELGGLYTNILTKQDRSDWKLIANTTLKEDVAEVSYSILNADEIHIEVMKGAPIAPDATTNVLYARLWGVPLIVKNALSNTTKCIVIHGRKICNEVILDYGVLSNYTEYNYSNAREGAFISKTAVNNMCGFYTSSANNVAKFSTGTKVRIWAKQKETK